MLTIKEYSVELVKDPFGILTGKRYEFVCDLDVPEDDELYSEHGVYLRVIYLDDEDASRIVKYDFYERTTDQYLDFDMEPEEEEELTAFAGAFAGRSLRQNDAVRKAPWRASLLIPCETCVLCVTIKAAKLLKKVLQRFHRFGKVIHNLG